MSTRTARGAMTLPGRYYTDETVFHAEIERIFLQRWLYAGRLSQLPANGSYFLYTVDKENVIVLRDEQGAVRAFYNVCRHRGTRMCSEPEGQFSHSIQCPYHAWTYSLDGSLIGAPNMHEVIDFDKAQYSLHNVSTAIWEGCIFINPSLPPAHFTEAFAPLINKFTQWHMPELVAVHRLEYDVRANWKLIFQNYSECYHCPGLHPALNQLTPYRNSGNDLMEGPFLGGPMRMARDGGSMTISGRVCAAPLGEVSGEDRNRVYYYTIFPNMLLSLHPDYALIHQIHPQSPDRSRIVCEWLFHPDAIAKTDFDPSGAIEFWNMTNLQDWHVSELSQQGISSRVYAPGPYAELESMVAAFDREYLRALGNHL